LISKHEFFRVSEIWLITFQVVPHSHPADAKAARPTRISEHHGERG